MEKTSIVKKPFNPLWLMPVAFALPILLMLLTGYGVIPAFLEFSALTIIYLGIGLLLAMAGIYLSASRVFIHDIKNPAQKQRAMEILVLSLATAFVSVLASAFTPYAALAVILIGAARLISLLNGYDAVTAKPARNAVMRPLRLRRRFRARARSVAVSVA